MTVKYDGRVSTYDTSEISHQTFYLTMFYNGCRCSMEPITSGSQVTLVYNLLWSNFERESPQNVPAFISTYLKVKDILSQWISLQEDLQECDNLKGIVTMQEKSYLEYVATFSSNCFSPSFFFFRRL